MKKLLCLCVATLAIAACNDKNLDPVANVATAAQDKDLQSKTFVSECSMKPLEALLTGLLSGGQSSIKGQRVAYRFEGANVTHTTRLFNTADCSGDAAWTFEETGDLKVDKSKKTNDNGYNMDLTYKKVTVAMATDAGATAANAFKLCGSADWAAKQSRDVTPKSAEATCYGAPLPRKLFQVYRVDANVFYLGNAAKISNNEKDRPSTVNMVDKYTAQ